MRIDWSFVKGSAVVGVGNVRLFGWRKNNMKQLFKLLNTRGGYP